ncbi:twin-arginine translocation signal domain-containing protein [uncultured Proteiniphilum sp.]|uniref:twin-arginine translocation signal domain-containing protein n=1 Tax=uncultured Proteiniphilum sp. TaxID=497637 RepID=UPI002607D35E|nr:twin-arginine translocation signal domain-containing protein [uncultured Proteiniphilum sp.]
MTSRRDFLKQSAVAGAAVALSPESVMGRNTGKNIPAAATPVDTYTVSMRSAMHIPVIQPREIIIPDTAGFQVLKGDFHVHTLFSDGQVMPVDRVKEAVQNGLDVISITDHIEYRPYFSKIGRWKLNDEQGEDFNLWYNTAKPEADKKQLLLVPGAEITKSTMPPGHFNALFTRDVNPIAAVVDDWRKMLQVAADQGCFLLWNHPGWQAPKSGGIEQGAPLRFTKEHEEVYRQGWMHGIEIFNGYEYYPIVSEWCNERDLAIFANSDIHPSELHQYGIHNPARPITLMLAKERTVESVREALFAKRTIGWAAHMLWGRDPWLPELFKASVEIKTITPGTVELTNKSSLPITVSLGGTAFNLLHNEKQQVYRAEGLRKLTVLNWMVGMNKPLEIPLDNLPG